MQIGDVRVQDAFDRWGQSLFGIRIRLSEGLYGAPSDAQLLGNLLFGHPLRQQCPDGLIAGVAPCPINLEGRTSA